MARWGNGGGVIYMSTLRSSRRSVNILLLRSITFDQPKNGSLEHIWAVGTIQFLFITLLYITNGDTLHSRKVRMLQYQVCRKFEMYSKRHTCLSTGN